MFIEQLLTNVDVLESRIRDLLTGDVNSFTRGQLQQPLSAIRSIVDHWVEERSWNPPSPAATAQLAEDLLRNNTLKGDTL